MSRLEKLKVELINDIFQIVNAVKSKEIYISDIDDGCSPIIDEDEYDGNNTYTLNKVYIKNGKLYFNGSSSFADYTWNQDNLSVDALCNVVDFLNEYEEEIKELK